MFLAVETPVDWEALKLRKQKATAKSNQRENSKRVARECKPGEWITIEKTGILRKVAVPRAGPCEALKHHNNGTATCDKEPFDIKRFRISGFHVI